MAAFAIGKYPLRRLPMEFDNHRAKRFHISYNADYSTLFMIIVSNGQESSKCPIESESKFLKQAPQQPLKDLNENVKKISKQIDLPKDWKNKSEESTIILSNDSISLPRKIKNAQKQRRQEQVAGTLFSR
jgi:hypothetical protein